MAKPSAHPGFKSLLREWNKKLADTGFQDIETEVYGDPTSKGALKGDAKKARYEKMHEITRHAKEVLYERLEENIKKTPLRPQLTFEFIQPKKPKVFFESLREYYIMKLYSQGYKQVEIQRILRIEGHRCQVFYPLYKWLKLWGLKR